MLKSYTIMKLTLTGPHIIDSIAEYHNLLGLPAPEHPLISVIDLACRADLIDLPDEKHLYNFYSIFLKKKHRRYHWLRS